jgi:Na+/melibiose symporter-like transporter
MNPIGLIVSTFLPFIFIKPESSRHDLKIQVFNYLTSYMLISAVWFVLIIASYSSDDDDDELDEEEQRKAKEEKEINEFEKLDFKTQVKILAHDRAYVGMFLAAAISYGCYTAMQFTLNFIVSVWGYEEARFPFNFQIFGSVTLMFGTLFGTLFAILYQVFLSNKGRQLRNFEILMIVM